ncbi:hypothetical protein [Psychroserpens sp. S379A]|uniref:hypothetical protein n=1 Tax=Psychroserpens sp. S379A TaxID=3415137 RepID=UPI003C7A3186
MKQYTLLLLIVIINLSCSKNQNLGQAAITEINSYNQKDSYFPHDCKTESELVDKMFELKKGEDIITINNYTDNGLNGHYITLKLNSKLEIFEAYYSEFTDVDDGSKTFFEIDSVDLKLNSNPFNSEKVIGYYSIYLTQYYLAGKLKKEGMKDDITKLEFRGKFKPCKN